MITTHITPITWEVDHLHVLDQRLLPREERIVHCSTVEAVAELIRTLAVRGAPLIGITAAYGMALAARQARNHGELADFHSLLAATRPTAVNLFWALERCRQRIAREEQADLATLAVSLLAEAREIHREDAAACEAMAQAGVTVFAPGTRVLTHCNTGALATGGIGTALGVIRAAAAAGRLEMVWVDETRPLLQGARLTAWELQQDGLPYRLICDNMAASAIRAKIVDLVIVGADRITRSGDFANKIGTYNLAVLAHAHGIPFYVAAPWSTLDTAMEGGADIPVEERAEEEVCRCGGVAVAPEGAQAWNPSFDVTPGVLVRGFITERGICIPPFS